MYENGYDYHQTVQIMMDRLNSVFPDADFFVFNDTGASCIVFGDKKNPDKLYKVYRPDLPQASRISLEEYQKGKRFYDQGEGLGPDMYDLFEGMPPILVMEKIEGGFAFKEQIINARNDLFDVFFRLKLVPGDVEFLWDEKNHRIRVIDVFSLTDRSDLDTHLLAKLINMELDSIIRTDGR